MNYSSSPGVLSNNVPKLVLAGIGLAVSLFLIVSIMSPSSAGNTFGFSRAEKKTVWHTMSDLDVKVAAYGAQAFVKTEQLNYLKYMDSLEVSDRKNLPTHRLKCEEHEAGLIRVKNNPKRGYCFGGADSEEKRTCDRHTPNYRKLGVNSHSLYDKKFHLKSWFHKSSFSKSLESVPEKRESITIASQGTWNRLEHLQHLAKTWNGPLSFALLVDENEDDLDSLNTIIENNVDLQRWVDIHIVWRKGHSSSDDDAFYPINMLRNIAMQTVNTDYVFVLDVDVTPNAMQHSYMEMIKESKKVSDSEVSKQDCPGLAAFIPAAVEMYPDKLNILKSNGQSMKKSHLVDMLRRGDAKPMHIYYCPAYGPTNHFEWMNDNTTTKINYLTRFEPYYIAKMPLPQFNEDFVDRGGNFAEQVYEMAASGYSFYRMPTAYVVDIPHGAPKSSDRRRSVLINKTKQKEHNMEFITDLWHKTRELMQRRYHVAMPDSDKTNTGFTTYRRRQQKMLNTIWKLVPEFENIGVTYGDDLVNNKEINK